ncbi:MAG: PAS domain S-box protein [Gemmatimonadota bacterium]
MLTTEEYRAVFEATPDGVLVVCSDGRIRDVNPQVERLFGYAREELLEEPVEILLPEAFRRAHEEHRARYVRNPRPRPMGVEMELRARRKDGTEFPAEISLSPWVPDAGGDLRVVCTVRDFTERKRMKDFSEGALRSVEEERQRIARELHDDTAQRLATLMLRLRVLAEVDDSAQRMRLAEDLREEILETAEAVKRIARGLRPPELDEVDLATALMAHFRGLREATGFHVDYDIDPVDDLLTEEARLSLYRIIQESLSNAVRHSGADGASVAVRRREDGVEVEIRDRGRGFSRERVEERGGGLGLIGMQERAYMAGGEVTVESEPGQGTVIRVQLPATRVEAHNV